MTLCPCCSSLPYSDCCQPYHNGAQPPTPLALMRSRYSAYAKNLPLYIQKTTHPKSPHREKNLKAWTQGIQAFSQTTKFLKLEIIDAQDNWVSFAAYLEQNSKPLILREKSYFEKVNGHWLYLRGEVNLD